LSTDFFFLNQTISVSGDHTATKFNADTHIQLFEQTFSNLGIKDMSDFVIVQTSDSTALNPKIPRMCNFFHVACQNHCLNLGCKDMEKNCAELKQLLDKTQEVHHKIKASNKLSAVLENVKASAQELDTSVWNGKIKLAAVT